MADNLALSASLQQLSPLSTAAYTHGDGVVDTQQQRYIEDEKARLAHSQQTSSHLSSSSASSSSTFHDSTAHHLNSLPTLSTYYSTDPIDRLRLRVLLRAADDVGTNTARRSKITTVKGLNLALKQRQLQQSAQEFTVIPPAADTFEEHRRQQQTTESNAPFMPSLQDRTIQQIVAWQQRIFSVRELLSMTHPSWRTQSVIARHQQQTLTETLHQLYPENPPRAAAHSYVLSQQRGVHIFTQCDEDGYVNPLTFRQQLTTKPPPVTEAITGATSSVHAAHHQKNVLQHPSMMNDMTTSLFSSSSQQTYKTFFICIAVDLPPDEHHIPQTLSECEHTGYEHVLCELRAYDNGQLYMTPGFSPPITDPDVMADEEWYEFWSERGQRFYYRIEHADLTDEQQQDTAAVIDTEDLSHHLLASSSLSHQLPAAIPDFEPPPPPGSYYYYVNAQIDTCDEFIDPTLYVQYELYLPRGWKLRDDTTEDDDENMLEARTQQCVAVRRYNDQTREYYNSSFVSFPFEFALIAQQTYHDDLMNDHTDHDDVDDNTTSHAPLRQPVLYLQVNSVDEWDCHRLAGYTYITLPSHAGPSCLSGRCWKPLGTLRSQLAEWLVGGSIQLMDRKAVGVDDQSITDGLGDDEDVSGVSGIRHKQSRLLNRFGFETVTTGTVNVSFDVGIYRSPVDIQRTREDIAKAQSRVSKSEAERSDSIDDDDEVKLESQLNRSELRQRVRTTIPAAKDRLSSLDERY